MELGLQDTAAGVEGTAGVTAPHPGVPHGPALGS